jgi:hypothetical protein
MQKGKSWLPMGASAFLLAANQVPEFLYPPP